jgi:hypothetical protein
VEDLRFRMSARMEVGVSSAHTLQTPVRVDFGIVHTEIEGSTSLPAPPDAAQSSL